MSKFTKFQIIFVSFLFSASTFAGGFYLGKRGFIYEIKRNPPEIKIINQTPNAEDVDFGLFWEVWSLVENKYLERPVDGQKMVHGAIQGMVQSLGDPYTSFLPPQINEIVTNSINGTYQGIGAELGFKDDQLIVVAPLDGSPAIAAGVKAGDKILKIEDGNTFGITINEAVSKIRGEAGTISTLTLQRGDLEPFVVRIKRGVVTVDSVVWEDKGNGTAYIRINQFGGETNSNWTKVVSELNSQMEELDAIVIDVRGNPGGFLQSSVFIAEEFFTDKTVLYQENAIGKQVSFEAERVGAFENVPEIFVLIDEGSASASEILAAALKANSNATLIGKTSFGKGTIQDAQDFSDGSGLHISVAKWLTPDKVWVHGVGITPDLEVEQDPQDIENEIDTQLEVALEVADKI